MTFSKTFKAEKMDIMMAIYIATIIVSELLGSKTTTILGLTFTVAIFALPITFTINDVVVEVYGKERARSFVRSGFLILFLLLGLTTLSVYLPPSARFASTNDAYVKVFSQSGRIILASITAFYLSEVTDVWIYTAIRDKMKNHFLWFRNNASNFVGQLIDSAVFMFLAFYKPGNFWFVVSITWPYWLLRCSMSVIETPLLYVGIAWLKRGQKAEL